MGSADAYNRCAQYKPYRFASGSPLTGSPSATCIEFSGTICLRSLLFGEKTP